MLDSLYYVYGLYYHHLPLYMLTKNEAILVNLTILTLVLVIAYGLYMVIPSGSSVLAPVPF